MWVYSHYFKKLLFSQQMIVVFSLCVPVIVMMETAVLSTDDCCFQSWCASYCYDANSCSLNRWLLFSVLVCQLLLWWKLLFSQQMIVVFSVGVPVIVMMESTVLSIDDCCFQSLCASYCYDGNCCSLNRWLLFSVLVFQLLLWWKVLFSQ